MFKELLELLSIKKEAKIVICTICVTAVAMYFIGDRLLFADRSAALNQYKSDIDNLKTESERQDKKIGEYSSELEQKNSQINDLNKEIARLQSFEQVLPEWKKALEDERTRSSNLQDQLNQINQAARDLRQASDSCTVEENNLKASNSKLNEIVSSYGPLLSKRNEIKGIENNKDSVEAKLSELDGDPVSRQFNVEKIAQLKRVSFEYQQQLLQLRQCDK
jgi:chromosome segregation ATPase